MKLIKSIALFSVLLTTASENLEAQSAKHKNCESRSSRISHSTKIKSTPDCISNVDYVKALLTQLEKQEDADNRKYRQLSSDNKKKYDGILKRIDTLERRNPQSYKITTLSQQARICLNNSPRE